MLRWPVFARASDARVRCASGCIRTPDAPATEDAPGGRTGVGSTTHGFFGHEHVFVVLAIKVLDQQQPKKLMRLVYKIVAKEKAPLIAGRTDLGVP
jgi:hypothetical protein